MVERAAGPGPLPRFEEALTHPSFANEAAVPDNQRLEFLGDAVLGLAVSEILAQEHPGADEGALTLMRAALVNTKALARWGRSANIGPSLALGRGARASGDDAQANVLADAVEALVACVYLAHGLDGARRFVREIVREPLGERQRLGARDPKNALQELVQARGLPAPTYRVIDVQGPAHARSCTVEVLVDGEVKGTGTGRSRKEAERGAAEEATAALETIEDGPPTADGS